MTQARILVRTLTNTLLVGSLLTTGAALATEEEDNQGLYSANELIGADVFAADTASQEVGEVEDVLFDNNMQLAAIVVENGSVLDADHRQFVVETGKFSVETHNGDSLDTMVYEVHLTLAQEEVSEQPEYTNNWWNDTKDSLNQAWESTQEGASSAWDATKEATSSVLDSAGSTIQGWGDKIQQSADKAEN